MFDTDKVIDSKLELKLEIDQIFKINEFEKEFKNTVSQCGFKSYSDIKNLSIIFDLSYTEWHDLGTLLWFISLLHKLKIQGNFIKLIFPEPNNYTGKRVWDFLIRWRFFDALTSCIDDVANLLIPEQVHYINRETRYKPTKNALQEKNESGEDEIFHSLGLLEITSLKSFGIDQEKNDELESYLQKHLKGILCKAFQFHFGWSEDLAKDFMGLVIREGIENSFLHSKNNFTNISMKTDAKNVILAICDNGIGIPESLREAFNKAKINPELTVGEKDFKLIEYFASEEMIKDSLTIALVVDESIGGRTGLFHLKNFVLQNNGELRIRSGKACVDFANNVEKPPIDYLFESPGTMLRITIPKIETEGKK